jgi:hypothetical protein
MDKQKALAILEEGIGMFRRVTMDEVRFVYDNDLLRTPDGIYTHLSSVHALRDEEWEEILHPGRSWIAATLIFDSDEKPIVLLDVGPKALERKGEVAQGVDINISASFSLQSLKYVS